MHLIVGLGNPGQRFEQTRHNTGFYMIDKMAGDKRWRRSTEGKYVYAEGEIRGNPVEYIKPQTFMNNSGLSVRRAQLKHNLPPRRIIVVHDDADLELGEVKISQGRGPGGHKGVSSVIRETGSRDFVRVRVGTGVQETEKLPLREFVLDEFEPGEKDKIEKAAGQVQKGVELMVTQGVQRAMTEIN